MRSSSARSGPTRLSVVPKGETASPAKTHEASEREADSEGTDLSLPNEIAGPLGAALDDANFKLESANTTPLGNDNIHFHRILGRSGSGASSAALLYVDERRLDAHQEAWFVYSVCIRICKQFKARKNETLCIIFLAPDTTRFLDTWKQQGEDLEDVGVVTAVNFRSVGSPAKWRNADPQTAMQYVHDWVRNVELRPLRDAADTFDPRREGPAGVSSDTTRPNDLATVGPTVFITYAHDDEKWYTDLRKTLKPLDLRYPGALWADKAIKPGADWMKQIEATLESAPIVVCLVSQSFLASDFIHKYEMNPAREAAEKKQKIILWVYVGKCMYADVGIGRWQAAHDITQPLNRLSIPEQEDQLLKVYEAVAEHLARLRTPGV